MNNEAREALGRVIENYGASICHTPRSCELFVRQECAAYPEEARVLIGALRGGITAELFRYQPSSHTWETFVVGLRKQCLPQSGLNEAEVDWAIDTWARVLGRHPEAWEAAPDVVAADAPPQKKVSRATFVTAMTAIVAAGGACGGALGAVMVPGILLITQVSTSLPFMEKPVRHGAKMEIWLIVFAILLVYAAIGAVGGALGSAAGWLFGKGDTNPWRGFSAAFGATFTTGALTGYFCPVVGWFFGPLFSGFGAARVCASRGGYS